MKHLEHVVALLKGVEHAFALHRRGDGRGIERGELCPSAIVLERTPDDDGQYPDRSARSEHRNGPERATFSVELELSVASCSDGQRLGDRAISVDDRLLESRLRERIEAVSAHDTEGPHRLAEERRDRYSAEGDGTRCRDRRDAGTLVDGGHLLDEARKASQLTS